MRPWRSCHGRFVMYEIMTKKGRNWQVLVMASELEPHLAVIGFLAQSGVAVRITWIDTKGSKNGTS